MTQERDTAKKLADILDYGADRLDPSTARRLAQMRERAMAGALAPARVTSAHMQLSGAGRHLHDYLHGHKLWITALVIATLAVLAFALLQQNITSGSPIETDTLLLASELPPEAYVDPGFHEWLENSSVL